MGRPGTGAYSAGWRTTRPAKSWSDSSNVYGWTREEAGWYTHPKLGGIVREIRATRNHTDKPGGWYWYPGAGGDKVENRQGPCATLRQAKRLAEKWRGE